MTEKTNIEVAVCFFGLTRSLKYTLSSIQKNIFDVLSKNNIKYHIYLHTYNLEYLTNPRANEYNVKLDISEWKLLNPDFYSITNQKDFDNTINIKEYLNCGDPWKDKCNSLLNLLRQLNSLQIVNKMINNDYNYKCLIYLRPDLKYLDKIDINQVLDIIKNSEQKIIYTPKWGRNQGCNDRCYIGTKLATNIIANRNDHIKEYSKTHKPHSERFMKYMIQSNNIINKNFSIIADRVRADGSINTKK